MNRTFTNFVTALSLTAILALAQGPNQGQQGPNQGQQIPPNSNPGLNMAKLQTVEGTVSGVQIAYGAQYPSILVNQTQIKVAPVWYLLENDFEIANGDSVRVTAAPANTANDPYLYAVEITKKANGAKITLRNELGVPLWMGAARRGSNPQAPRTGGACVDPASIKTATGTVDRVTLGAGIQHPNLVLNSGGTLITVELGPERMLLDSDLELKPGSTVTVKYGLATCMEENVAIEISDTAGHTVVLRHNDGTPAWND